MSVALMIWLCPTCHASNRDVDQKCEACGGLRPTLDPTAPMVKKVCHDCGAAFEFWTGLYAGEDGIRRCASCHHAYLGRRAFGVTDTTVCTEPNCTKTVGQHRSDLRALVARLTSVLTPI